MTLTPKQLLFCLEHTTDLNGTAAYIRAGYSPRGAKQAAHKLLTNADVKAEIARIQSERFKAIHMSAEEVLSLLAKRARATARRMLKHTPDGDPYWDLTLATDDDLDNIGAAKIKDVIEDRTVDPETGAVTQRTVRAVEVKMHDALPALNLLARHHALLRDRVELEVGEDFAELMAAAMKRAGGGE